MTTMLNARSRVGLNFGPFPMHDGPVSLVLSLVTEQASPRFSVVHDDFFETQVTIVTACRPNPCGRYCLNWIMHPNAPEGQNGGKVYDVLNA